jgi:hypothetical protein
MYVPIIPPPVAFGLGGLGLAIYGIRIFLDRTTKLILNQNEMIDHRATGGEFRIRWDDVASVDCELRGYNGTLVVYKRDQSTVSTDEVNLSGLDHSASDIFVEIKKLLLALPSSSLANELAILHDAGTTEIRAGAPDLPRSTNG